MNNNNLTLVRIHLAFSMPPEDYRAMCHHAAEVIAQQQGLIWKMWPIDEEKRIGGGVYLFERRQQAEAYVTGPIIERMRNAPGIYDVEITITDVETTLGELTFAPMRRESTS